MSSGRASGMTVSTVWRSVWSAATSCWRDVLVALDHEDPRLALDDRVRVGPVVLVERVAGRLDDDPEAQEARLLGREQELDAVGALGEVHGLACPRARR